MQPPAGLCPHPIQASSSGDHPLLDHDPLPSATPSSMPLKQRVPPNPALPETTATIGSFLPEALPDPTAALTLSALPEPSQSNSSGHSQSIPLGTLAPPSKTTSSLTLVPNRSDSAQLQHGASTDPLTTSANFPLPQPGQLKPHALTAGVAASATPALDGTPIKPTALTGSCSSAGIIADITCISWFWKHAVCIAAKSRSCGCKWSWKWAAPASSLNSFFLAAGSAPSRRCVWLNQPPWDTAAAAWTGPSNPSKRRPAAGWPWLLSRCCVWLKRPPWDAAAAAWRGAFSPSKQWLTAGWGRRCVWLHLPSWNTAAWTDPSGPNNLQPTASCSRTCVWLNCSSRNAAAWTGPVHSSKQWLAAGWMPGRSCMWLNCTYSCPTAEWAMGPHHLLSP